MKFSEHAKAANVTNGGMGFIPHKMTMNKKFSYLNPCILITLFLLCSSCGFGPDWGRPATEQEKATFEHRPIPSWDGMVRSLVS